MKLSGRLAEEGLEPFIAERFAIKGRKMPKVWILVIDASKVYFFRKPNHHLERIGEAFPKQKTSDKATIDRTGRMSNFGKGQHRLEVHDNVLKHHSKTFMKELAEYLDEAARKEAYDRLVLISSPKTLGMLRPLLSKNVNIRINAQLDKDLTHLNEKQLFDYLDKLIWV